MITIRKAEDRGPADFGWLKSRHSFSFGQYYDPKHMGFRSLRVINEDRVAPGAGFGAHPHKDMEILSYVLDGGLEHKDSLGTGSVIKPGDVQRMTAGTGVTHSEFNASRTDPVHFLQIWLLPEAKNLAPGYEQTSFASERDGRLALVASRDGRDGSLTIHQDANIFASVLKAGGEAELSIAEGRGAWVQVARGSLAVNGERLDAGDGAAIEDVRRLAFATDEGAEFLVFDLA
ncbi:MAG: pirin family protein [Pseudomonadota bacterium]